MLNEEFDTGDEAVRGVLSTLEKAAHFDADGKEATKLRRGFREELNYGFVLANPRARLTEKLSLYSAVARFVWMMAGNNRLADIAFHEPKVSTFTDDLLTVPGSSYGMRLRQSQPGLDQVAGAIHRLTTENDSRRAAVSIFHPIDAVRESKDIPCAFGLLFHNRNGTLSTTVMMRSNNAFRLLPFNIFEFSLLAEVVAIEAKLRLGSLTYFAGSMHLYDSDSDECSAFLHTPEEKHAPMSAVPSDVSPLEQINRICRFEIELRHGSAAITAKNVDSWIDKAQEGLRPFWAQVSLILLSGVTARLTDGAFEPVASRIVKDLKSLLPGPSTAKRATAARLGPLFDGAVETKILPLWRSDTALQFEALAKAHEEKTGALLGAHHLLRAQSIVLDRLAARGEVSALTPEVFLAALKQASEND